MIRILLTAAAYVAGALAIFGVASFAIAFISFGIMMGIF